MADTFVLWDRDTANALGAYPTWDAAVERVRRFVRAKGRDILDDLVVVKQDANGVPSAFYAGADVIGPPKQTAGIVSASYVYLPVAAGTWSYRTEGSVAVYSPPPVETLVSMDAKYWLLTEDLLLDVTSSLEATVAPVGRKVTFSWSKGEDRAESSSAAANKQSTLALAA